MAKAKKEDVVEDNLVEEEKEAVKKEELDRVAAPEESFSDQEIDVFDTERETGTEEKVAPEVAAVRADTETAQEMDKKTVPDIKKKSKLSQKSSKLPIKKVQKKIRSQKYQKALQIVEAKKKYPLKEALEIIKRTSYSKFDGTVNMAVRLEKTKKTDEAVRGTIKLPHGTGKKLNVVIASDDIVEKIKKGWLDFDVLVATPQLMPKLTQVAKILGPKGKMPNPKDGTITDDPKGAIEDLGEKVVRYRADIGRNVHIPIGKVSWEKEKLIENAQTVLKTVARYRKESITLSPTMGPGIKIETK